MPGSVTAREVMAELQRHMDRCETLNNATTQAFTSMSESHRALANEMKQTRKEFSDRWDRLNSAAWKGLGAIGLTILAGVIGVAFQNISLAHTAATQAAQQVAAQRHVP